MSKKRILFVGEASVLSTGFSVYYRELLPRLVATGKYEIAELSSYIRPDDARMIDFVKGRWKWYGVMPTNEQEHQIFSQNSNHPRDKGQNINQFGAWKFDMACADFQPDIVIDIRDNWMLTWQLRSPFRQWFKWLIMPTVDAVPQAEEWIQDFERADLVMAYSDFGIHAMKQQSPRIKIFPKPMRPGVDINTFKPIDRSLIRAKFGIKEDVPIIGTTMRNQSRKLFPDLIDAFALMKKKYKGEFAVDKSVLLLHTAWPDNMFSYDYPRHIMRLQSYPWMTNHFKGIKDSVLQTLTCHNAACKKTSIGFAMALYNRPLQGNLIPMPCCWCGKNEATCPTVGQGLSREELAEIYNLMDLYVQCSICEGEGMPCNEAKACGKPTLVVNYSALAEKGRFPAEYMNIKELGIKEEDYKFHKGGDVLEVGRFYYEAETSCMRALPNINDMADKMREVITNDALRKKMGEEAREAMVACCDSDKLAKQWEYVLDNVKVKDRSNTWDSPIILKDRTEAQKPPEGLSNEQHVEWLYLNILKYPKVDTQGAEMWINYLKQGLPREQLMQQFLAIANQGENEDSVRQKIRAEIAKLKNPSSIVETRSDWV